MKIKAFYIRDLMTKIPVAAIKMVDSESFGDVNSAQDKVVWSLGFSRQHIVLFGLDLSINRRPVYSYLNHKEPCLAVVHHWLAYAPEHWGNLKDGDHINARTFLDDPALINNPMPPLLEPD